MMIPFLDAGENSVGYKIEVKHSAPTTIGMKVTLKAVATESTERKAVFSVEAYNETGVKIGEGKHERRAIDMTRFTGPSTKA
jgi:predicted thioesterase